MSTQGGNDIDAVKPPVKMTGGPSRSWGSGGWRHGHVLPEAGAERAVVDGAADLEQPVGAAPGQRICCDLAIRRLTRKLAVPSVSAVPTRSPARCRSA